MAKKRKSYKRRRVGALSLNTSSPVVKLATVAAGYLLGGTINGVIDRLTPGTPGADGTVTPSKLATVVKYGQVGLGGYLLLRKKKSMIGTVAGGILAGAGLRRIMPSMLGSYRVNGYQSVPVIGGYQSVPVIGNVPAQLQGLPAQLQGYTTRRAGVMGSIGRADGSGLMRASGCMG